MPAGSAVFARPNKGAPGPAFYMERFSHKFDGRRMNASNTISTYIGRMKQKLGTDRSKATPRKLDQASVLSAYARWAPLYDGVFKMPLFWGQRAAARHVNALDGRVLEAGIGTGMSLPLYADHLSITGIDLSEEMLAKARKKAAGRSNIEDLLLMDAAALSFPDNHFDVTVAAYVITVVPDPAKVIAEFERVTKPGGRVILVNHFSTTTGLRSLAERGLEHVKHRLGWNPEFRKAQLLELTDLRLEAEEILPPFGLFTLLSFRKPHEPT